MTTRKTYDVLAEAFRQEGVDTCFALLGDANMNWATSLAERGARMIYVRHEHNAVSAAMSHARATGAPGVATVTCGPGLTQILTALPAAVRAGIPLVVFAGEAPLKSAWYNQAIDQAPFITATGAAYRALHHPERMPAEIRDAFLQARMENRPVVLGVPFDLQNRDWTGPDTLPAPSRQIMPRVGRMHPAPDDVARAAAMVDGASRIVVMAGRGAVVADAGAACRALAEKTGGLLATTLPARGLFHDDPFSLGIAGGFSTTVARELLAEADLVIAAGTILAHHNADGGKLFPRAAVLQIDTDPRAISQGRLAAQDHIRADARVGVEALTAAITPAEGGRVWRSAPIARAIAETPADMAVFPAPAEGTFDPRDVVAALDAAIPADWECVNSSGHCSFYFAQMPHRPVAHFHTIREFGAIGNGLAYAMGVAAARPGRKVVLFDGDGSLLMNVQELETIRRHKLDIAICVLNDGAYGSEIHKLRSEGISDAGAVFGYPDLGAIARGFGIDGRKVSALDDVAGLVEAFGAGSGPALWDFHVCDKIASPVIRRAHPHGHAGVEQAVPWERFR
ncbi:thiamine pyrophosphate-binding protein [Acuticoccus sp. MNP-M23]|uniref:thiamine pyrophosphate-binding protein n=1 Tax=Acuticoccus sp. MNP-M23 TaxID=3072793 RepID=UPI002816677D|nr:thiamine pyrophosphate-binding protein [Acuticoccus sp. MNP-M23]WMS44460.1 thiamine pyrophosphate-binding protein [Acuticoccus sp. MNP-M23]